MRDPVRHHHPLEEVCEVIDCPEPHERIDGNEECGAVLEVGRANACVCRFVCRRPRGHRLVHIDNARARANGEPGWAMCWGGDV